MAYFINLFTEETWRESRDRGFDVTGHTPRLRNRDRISTGDIFLCYVTGLSAFVGALEVTGDVYEVGADGDRIWKRALFPLRYPTKLVARVPVAEGISLGELRLRSADDQLWKWVFRNSGNEIPTDQGEWILSELRSREQLPADVEEPFTAASDEVEVGEGVSGARGRSDQHTRAQFELASLGMRSGFDVWIARNDRSAQIDGVRLGDLSIPELPDGLPREHLKTVELIDVLWLKRGRTYVAAFEVETTTPIFTGMLRMGDLVTAIPNIKIPLYLVAPDDRRAKVFEQLTRPLFRYGLEPPLHEICSYLPLETLLEECAKFAHTPGVIDGHRLVEDIAEWAQ